jgi:hypothetical protein
MSPPFQAFLTKPIPSPLLIPAPRFTSNTNSLYGPSTVVPSGLQASCHPFYHLVQPDLPTSKPVKTSKKSAQIGLLCMLRPSSVSSSSFLLNGRPYQSPSLSISPCAALTLSSPYNQNLIYPSLNAYRMQRIIASQFDSAVSANRARSTDQALQPECFFLPIA